MCSCLNYYNCVHCRGFRRERSASMFHRVGTPKRQREQQGLSVLTEEKISLKEGQRIELKNLKISFVWTITLLWSNVLLCGLYFLHKLYILSCSNMLEFYHTLVYLNGKRQKSTTILDHICEDKIRIFWLVLTFWQLFKGLF